MVRRVRSLPDDQAGEFDVEILFSTIISNLWEIFDSMNVDYSLLFV